MDKYINPFVDYGFKLLFATEQNKDLLISLLNAIMDDEVDPIIDLQYKDVEEIGDIIGTRANYFDVYCQTRNGRRFIVEMQNKWEPFFKDRNKDDEYRKDHSTIQTLSRLLERNAIPPEKAFEIRRGIRFLQEMEEKREREIKEKYGDDWVCRFDEVYIVAVMDFMLPSTDYPIDSFIHKIEFNKIEDSHVFYDKLTLYYIEMPKIIDMDLKMDSMLNKWMHAMSYLCYYDDFPNDLQEDVFIKLSKQARIGL